MAATLMLEKKVFIAGEGVNQQNQQSGIIVSETCSCGESHMYSHNAMCRACSTVKSSAK